MRNPDRLDAFYDRMKQLHKKTIPDWRFGQMIMNFLAAYGDVFYWEEDRFLDKFEEYIASIK